MIFGSEMIIRVAYMFCIVHYFEIDFARISLFGWSSRDLKRQMAFNKKKCFPVGMPCNLHGILSLVDHKVNFPLRISFIQEDPIQLVISKSKTRNSNALNLFQILSAIMLWFVQVSIRRRWALRREWIWWETLNSYTWTCLQDVR